MGCTQFRKPKGEGQGRTEFVEAASIVRIAEPLQEAYEMKSAGNPGSILAGTLLRHLDHAAAFTANVNESSEPKGFVFDHPGPSNEFRTTAADDVNSCFPDSGLHDHWCDGARSW